MTVSFSINPEHSGTQATDMRSRFETCLRLDDGHAAFPVTRIDPLFEDQPVSFGRVAQTMTAATPGDWLVKAIRRLANAATELEMAARPIHVPMPIAIFTDDRAASLAANAASEKGFCTQEFMLEVQDASLASGESEAFDCLDAFRSKGFRIALDARKSAVTPFSSRIRSAIERLRVNAEELMFDEMLQLRADIVACIGGEVIVDRANWQHAEELQRYGASHALKLIADA